MLRSMSTLSNLLPRRKQKVISTLSELQRKISRSPNVETDREQQFVTPSGNNARNATRSVQRA